MNELYNQDKPLISGRWWVHAIIMLGLMIGTWVLYLPDLGLGFFHLDDPTYVSGNRHIQGMTGENLKFILTTPYFANFSPLHLFTYMTDFEIAKLDPHIYHVTSNVWGALCSALVYLLGVVLLRNGVLAFFCGILFMLHPAHVEAIAWISSRKDLIATVFAVPSVLAYLKYRRGGDRAFWWYGLSILCFILAEAGKQSVVILPGILILFDWFVERRHPLRSVWDKIPYGIIAVVFAVVVMKAQPSTGFEFSLFGLAHTLAEYFILATGFGEYVLYRLRPPATTPFLIQAGYLVLLLGIALGPLLLWYLKKVSGLFVVLYYWFLVAIAPSQALNVVHPVSDRYLFFPSVGSVLLVVWLAQRILGKTRLAIPVVLLSFVAVGWGYNTCTYLAEWKDPRSVWYAAVEKSEDPNAPLYLATHLQDMTDTMRLKRTKGTGWSTSENQFAAKIWDNNPALDQLVPIEKWDLNTSALAEKLENEVRAEIWEIFDRTDEIRGNRNMPNLYFRRGKFKMDDKKLDEAKSEFERALEMSKTHTSSDVRDPLFVHCNFALGIIEWQKRNYDGAHEYMQIAEQRQRQLNGNWVPQLPNQLARLKGMLTK